jgi:hypothetical protein
LKHLVLAAALSLAACAATPEPAAPASKPDPNAVRLLAVTTSYFRGTFESIAQDKGPGVGVRMRIAPFWTELNVQGVFFFYVEHARIGEDDKPFMQRIYRFATLGQRLHADVMSLPGDAKQFVNEWRKPKPFEAYGPRDVREFPGCRMPIGSMTAMFWMHTPGKGCQTGLYPGAAYERTDVFASSVGMQMGTFGYDPAGRQVAGEAGVWDFRKKTSEPR